MDFKELLAFQKSFQLAMDIFQLSKSFQKKKSIRSQIKFDVLLEVFLPILQKHTEKDATQIIL